MSSPLVEVRVVGTHALHPGPPGCVEWQLKREHHDFVAGLDQLFAVDVRVHRGSSDAVFRAPAEDVARWDRATRRYVAEVRAVDEAVDAAIDALWPCSAVRRLLGGSTARRQRRYDAAVAQLRERVRTAHEALRRDTLDLVEPAAAAVQRAAEAERRRQEWIERAGSSPPGGGAPAGRSHGPSSTYWSPGGAGDPSHGGGGDAGGGFGSF